MQDDLPGHSAAGGADLAEAVSTLLWKLHDDINVDRPLRDFSEFDPSEPATPAWVKLLSTDESIVISLFWGVSREQTRCTSCGHTGDDVQPCELFRVSLPPVDPGVTLHLQDCIGFATEWTGFKEMAKCTCPTKEVLMESRIRFVKLPRILIIQLVRFEEDPQLSAPEHIVIRKNTTRVEFPESLDMSPWVENSPSVGDCTYQLHAVLQHLGSYGERFNHYVACVLTARGWYHFNDAVVSARIAIPVRDTLHEMNPYALVYVQQQ
jgi:ubiquitin C-terminal hydrolase